MSRQTSKAELKKSWPKGKIGILGGGQLARMLCLKAYELGFVPVVYCAHANEPAAQVCPQLALGNFTDLDSLNAFCQNVDIITFESEFVPKPVLIQLQNQFPEKFRPSTACMLSLQDRLLQKELLVKFKLNTAPFFQLTHFDQIKNLDSELVIKRRTNAYDGNGTFFVSPRTLSPSELSDILKSDDGGGFIAEEKIKFKQEMALMVVRDSFRNIRFFPLVKSEQVEATCLFVSGPYQHKKLGALKSKIKKLLNHIDYVGSIGFELFDTGKELLINELAPRVHNSGHYTLHSHWPDQFTAHLIAVAGFELVEPRGYSAKKEGFAMANLLGSSKAPAQASLKKSFQEPLFWYGKDSIRRKRKLGHINSFASSPSAALLRVKKELKGYDI